MRRRGEGGRQVFMRRRDACQEEGCLRGREVYLRRRGGAYEEKRCL